MVSGATSCWRGHAVADSNRGAGVLLEGTADQWVKVSAELVGTHLIGGGNFRKASRVANETAARQPAAEIAGRYSAFKLSEDRGP